MKIKLIVFVLACFVLNVSFGQIKLKDLKVDTTIAAFQFAADFQGTMVFTKNGPSDIKTINPSAFSFTIAPNMTAEIVKEQLEILLQMSIQNGYEISNLVKKDTTFKGYNSYYISYTETYEKEHYKNFIFNAFVIKDNSLILFTSGDLDNGLYLEKFKRTFYNIKL